MSETKKVKKKFRWWLIPLIVFAVIGVGALALKGIGYKLDKMQSVPKNYSDTVKTGGDIESKYLSTGEHDVTYLEAMAMSSFKKYEIFYPADIDKINEPLPVVVFVNGTGMKGSKYQALQKHIASWGFISIATEEEYAWNGFSAEMSVRFLEQLNDMEVFYEKDNALYKKININRIGITGHSQGGFGVVNAITNQRHAKNYKAAVMLSCSPSYNKDFLWDADTSLIDTPMLMIGSTGSWDSNLAPLESLQTVYSNIPDGIDKVIARRNDADHGQMLYYADGYVTAWFMHYLMDDAEAGDAFFGENAEIQTNELYQDQQVGN